MPLSISTAALTCALVQGFLTHRYIRLWVPVPLIFLFNFAHIDQTIGFLEPYSCYSFLPRCVHLRPFALCWLCLARFRHISRYPNHQMEQSGTTCFTPDANEDVVRR